MDVSLQNTEHINDLLAYKAPQTICGVIGTCKHERIIGVSRQLLRMCRACDLSPFTRGWPLSWSLRLSMSTILRVWLQPEARVNQFYLTAQPWLRPGTWLQIRLRLIPLLWRQAAPSKLARICKVKCNPPIGKKCSSAGHCQHTPADRVKQYPDKHFIVSAKRLFCTACGEEISTKKSVITKKSFVSRNKLNNSRSNKILL